MLYEAYVAVIALAVLLGVLHRRELPSVALLLAAFLLLLLATISAEAAGSSTEAEAETVTVMTLCTRGYSLTEDGIVSYVGDWQTRKRFLLLERPDSTTLFILMACTGA